MACGGLKPKTVISERPAEIGIADVCQIRHNEHGDEGRSRTKPEACLLGGFKQEGPEEVPEGRPAGGRASVVRRPDGRQAPARSHSGALAARACSRWSRTTTGTPTGRSTPSSLPALSTCSTPSKRSRRRASKPRRKKSR